MIRHIDNRLTYTNEAIAESLGLFDLQKEPVKLLLDLKKRFPLPIHKVRNPLKPRQIQSAMSKDDICHLYSEMLWSGEKIAEELWISRRTLDKLLKEPDFPVIRSLFSSDSYSHRNVLALKSVVADWYSRYRLASFNQTGNVKHWNRVKNDLQKILCGTCCKPKFLIPGLTVEEVPALNYRVSSDLSTDSYTAQIRDEKPVCPVCKASVHPFTCCHTFLNV